MNTYHYSVYLNSLHIFWKKFYRFPKGCKAEIILLHSREESKFIFEEQISFFNFPNCSSAQENTEETTNIQELGLQSTSRNPIHILAL